MNDFDWFVNFQNEMSFDGFLFNFVYKSITSDNFLDFLHFSDFYWFVMCLDWFSSIFQIPKWNCVWCFSFKLCLQIDHFGPFLRFFTFFLSLIDFCDFRSIFIHFHWFLMGGYSLGGYNLGGYTLHIDHVGPFLRFLNFFEMLIDF